MMYEQDGSFLLNDVLSVEIHGFSDSSLSMYCAVVYVRIIAKTGIKVFFWTLNTRVAPLKTVSIPRLELLGCLLLSELIHFIMSRGQLLVGWRLIW